VTLLTWSHECIIGVQAMDDQHGALMDTLNDLRRMLLRGEDRHEICQQLKRLIELTQMHCQGEEQLLRKQAFPGLDEHRSAHQQLMARLYGALEQVNREDGAHFGSVLDFLPSWYIEHVEQLDQPYGAWLNERGVY
jgi:hemerythrin